MEYRRFSVEFVERTKHLLQEYGGDYEVTNILNCTLGLVILPYETNGEEFSEVQLEELQSFTGLKISFRKESRNSRIGNSSNLLRRIRNGLSHSHIVPKSSGGNVTGVIIWDYNVSNCHASNSYLSNERKLYEKCAEVEFEFSCEGLKKFALFIADKYLEAMKKH